MLDAVGLLYVSHDVRFQVLVSHTVVVVPVKEIRNHVLKGPVRSKLLTDLVKHVLVFFASLVAEVVYQLGKLVGFKNFFCHGLYSMAREALQAIVLAKTRQFLKI